MPEYLLEHLYAAYEQEGWEASEALKRAQTLYAELKRMKWREKKRALLAARHEVLMSTLEMDRGVETEAQPRNQG
jgi:hypothetical protein